MPRMLLVSDAPWVIEAVRAAVVEAGADLAVTTDPARAPSLALEQGAEVVLADLQIGSMGGMALTRAIRTAARTAGAPSPAVILLLDRDADAFLAGRAAADAWIRKPFDSSALRRLLEQAAAERSGQSAAP